MKGACVKQVPLYAFPTTAQARRHFSPDQPRTIGNSPVRIAGTDKYIVGSAKKAGEELGKSKASRRTTCLSQGLGFTIAGAVAGSQV